SGLAATGYARFDGDEMWLTPAGAQQVDYVHSLLLAWLVDKLARSPGFEVRPDRSQVQAALERVAHRVLAQRDWHDEAPTAAVSAGVPSRHEPNRNIR
ncbi:MAG: MFS transporter, partial [Mycobacterium sp.]